MNASFDVNWIQIKVSVGKLLLFDKVSSFPRKLAAVLLILFFEKSKMQAKMADM